MKTLGLDEAGRGCVLGPLVVGAFLYHGDDQSALRAAGADDSKALSPARRDAVKARLQEMGTSAIRAISPAEIDAGNVNSLEEQAFISLILQFEPDAVYLDAPVTPRGIPALVRRLEAAVAAAGLKRPRLVVEPKADATWPVVGAASIFAKTTRDAAIAALGPVGSGYPSDPVTRDWLRGFLTRGEPFPDCVRTRWGTIDALRQGSLFDRPGARG